MQSGPNGSTSFRSLLTDAGADGVPSFAATLARLRGEWKRDAEEIERWEHERRFWPANPGEVWDDLYARCRCRECAECPAMDDRTFLEAHYDELRRLMHSIACRTACSVLDHMDMWVASHTSKYQKNRDIAKILEEEGGNDRLLGALLRDAVADGQTHALALAEAGAGDGTTARNPGAAANASEGGGDERGAKNPAAENQQRAGRVDGVELEALAGGAPMGCAGAHQLEVRRAFAAVHANFTAEHRTTDGVGPPPDAAHSDVACAGAEGSEGADALRAMLDTVQEEDAHAGALRFVAQAVEDEDADADKLDALRKAQNRRFNEMKAVGVAPPKGLSDTVLEERARTAVMQRLRSGRVPPAEELAALRDASMDAARAAADGGATPTEDDVVAGLREAVAGMQRAEIVDRVGDCRAWVYEVMWCYANSPTRPLNHEQVGIVALVTPVLAGLLDDALELGGGAEHPEYARKQERTMGGANAPEAPPKDPADAAVADAFLHSPSGADIDWRAYTAEGRWGSLDLPRSNRDLR